MIFKKNENISTTLATSGQHLRIPRWSKGTIITIMLRLDHARLYFKLTYISFTKNYLHSISSSTGHPLTYGGTSPLYCAYSNNILFECNTVQNLQSVNSTVNVKSPLGTQKASTVSSLTL